MNDIIKLICIEDQNEEVLSNSPYWPQYIERNINGEIILGTFVRIYRNDKWYKIPVIERYKLFDEVYVPQILFEKLACTCYKIQYLYIVDPENETITIRNKTYNLIDELQISEQERLSKIPYL